MSRVENNAEVTLVVLVYRSLKWLERCMGETDDRHNNRRYRWLVVANDPTPEVEADPRVSLVFRNDDPSEFYINRVYRAWNAGVIEAPTQRVIMLNSDMFGSDYWIDALVAHKTEFSNTLPTSLLVESGRLPSGMPEYVKDFGKTPNDFDSAAFQLHARTLRNEREVSEGRLFMPMLVERQEFIDIGKYPEGNPPGTTGDKDLVRRYAEKGIKHVTCHGSVVAHIQLGEQEWVEKKTT